MRRLSLNRKCISPKKLINTNTFETTLTLPVLYGEGRFSELFNMSFLVSVSGQIGGSSIYRSNSLFFVSITGGVGAGYGGGSGYRVNFTPVAVHKGGLDNLSEINISSVTINDSTNAYVDRSQVEKEMKLKFTFTSLIVRGQVDITPIAGNGQMTYE